MPGRSEPYLHSASFRPGHYAITSDFLNHYPRRLEQLLAADDED